MMRIPTLLVAASVLAGCASTQQPPQTGMSFFLTSAGPGNGANLGGLDGADRHCAMLADAVNVVHARNRIGAGPWYNQKGDLIAQSVADLHSENPRWTKQTVVNERGEVVNGRGDTPNRHDILTGSQLDGTAYAAGTDSTCNNWTSSGEGSARVGHFDKVGGGDNPNSWNSAHASRGCSQANLQATGGDGLFYCFAIN
jgi:hypothetical protein